MALLLPKKPPYSVRAWQTWPFPERMRAVCRAWALQGYGTPFPIYFVYLLKIGLYIAGWALFCRTNAAPAWAGTFEEIGTWAFTKEAFQKAVLWSMAFESLGLGCGSGPLTGRYFPPLGGFLYFARPGTTKLPLFPGLPFVGGDRRTWFDVLLYVAHIGCLIRALLAPAITAEVLLPTVVLLPILAVCDKTQFLVARGEHFYTAILCFLFPDWLAGTKVLWLSVWLWAATSKLNRHFPSVIAVMQSNSPLTAFFGMRKWLFRRYPDDLRPSRLTHAMGHAGTLVEYAFPITLAISDGGRATTIALVTVVLFHAFITSSIPMGVPLEWNVIMVYGAFFLFGHHAAERAHHLTSPALIALLAVGCIGVQVYGNFVPSRVSFLVSMRYYAGNWPFSVWLFRGDASKKLDAGLVKSAPRVQDQLAKLYDEETIVALLSKVQAFRAMHLQGRALQLLLPRAVDDIDAYEYQDGEIVAGVVLGWNFGDGHLHQRDLLRAVQRQCQFAEGELRCVFVESQPLFVPRMAWTIADAAKGILAQGHIRVEDLEALDPWPAIAPKEGAPAGSEVRPAQEPAPVP